MILNLINRILRRNDSTDLGPNEIIEAVYGNRPVTDIQSAVMGTPIMRDFGTEYSTDYRVLIPLDAGADMDLPDLVYDVPEDPYLSDDLGEFSRFYNVETVEELVILEGEEVPIDWNDGFPAPDMNQLRSDDVGVLADKDSPSCRKRLRDWTV
jgi:hypothetical protein